MSEIEEATHRISTLVTAAKNYSHMDRAGHEWVDVHEGLKSTLVMLTHRLRGITVVKELDHTLPKVLAYPGELNQVWTNIIDNAAAAMDGSGTLTIRTSRDGDQLLVEICDTGPGHPAGARRSGSSSRSSRRRASARAPASGSTSRGRSSSTGTAATSASSPPPATPVSRSASPCATPTPPPSRADHAHPGPIMRLPWSDREVHDQRSSVRRRRARYIASVPWTWGQSWTSGPSPSSSAGRARLLHGSRASSRSTSSRLRRTSSTTIRVSAGCGEQVT